MLGNFGIEKLSEYQNKNTRNTKKEVQMGENWRKSGDGEQQRVTLFS